MTREDAIEILKNPNEMYQGTDGVVGYTFNPNRRNYEAFQLAIKALEQEPCEDAVSRKAVLNLARDLEFGKIKGMENYKHRCIEIEDVEELPPVMPDLSSLREINEALTKRVQFLETMNKYATPVIPTRKKGKWIDSVYSLGFTCTCCLTTQTSGCRYKYCPNCGARMESEK